MGDLQLPSLYEKTSYMRQLTPLPFIFSLCLILLTGCRQKQTEETAEGSAFPFLESLGLSVSPTENRIFSYTDKASGYYYATTHSDLHGDYFHGWNRATKRLLRDYHLFADGDSLRRATAAVMVYPHFMQRRFGQATEQLALFDELPVLMLSIDAPRASTLGISIDESLCRFSYKSTQGIWFMPLEATNTRILVAPRRQSTSTYANGRLEAPASCAGFYLIHGSQKADILQTLERVRAEEQRLLQQRWQRMETLARHASPASDRDTLNRALSWLALTLDQLVVTAPAEGIYAGLPWFNDYWGRDMFVSFAGACLVNGQFETARQLLVSFAALQQTDPSSPTYGRIPNRARPNDRIYNTADGTPRFVAAIRDYVAYSGDTSIVRALFPVVQRSIEGSLTYWTDARGYLRHEDADTWMDARIKGETPYSPRGDRANDVQYLWVEQLRSAAWMASLVGARDLQKTWTARAQQVAERFQKDFFLKEKGYLADHLNADGSADTQLRPNQLFALSLLPDSPAKRQLLKTVWEKLCYPWGVASLSQEDPGFHPYHEHWNYYHKDAAYHNGTVWLWLNGIAMQRLVEAGQPEIAWQLFKKMNQQALREGAVGSLSENADALPRPGLRRGKPSGTFLQAWSNAEHLRIWYQYFLGVRPDLTRHEVLLQPAIPDGIRKLNQTVRIGKSWLHCTYQDNGAATYSYTVDGEDTDLRVSIPPFPTFKKSVASGMTLQIQNQIDYLDVHILKQGRSVESFQIDIDLGKKTQMRADQEFWRGVAFCKPYLQPNLPALRVFHDPALTY